LFEGSNTSYLLQKKRRQEPSAALPASKTGTLEVPSTAEVLSNIHVLRATSAAEQLAALVALPKLLETLSNVRVVVLDSMAFHFRHTNSDFAARSRSIRAISDALRAVVAMETVAVSVVWCSALAFWVDTSKLRRWSSQIT
jgi:RAD51-like protein 2